jgi:phospholipase C
MRYRMFAVASLFCLLGATAVSVAIAHAEGDLHKVNHIIIVMQENHSFDNYFGALPYDPAGPYHGGGCSKNDHSCVDGLTCTVDTLGHFTCTNSNLDGDGSVVHAFHESKYCTGPDLDHSWSGSHIEANFNNPAASIISSPNDGFVLRNDVTSQGQPDSGPETANSDDAMGFYTQADLPFYYNLAENFAIDDRFSVRSSGRLSPIDRICWLQLHSAI